MLTKLKQKVQQLLSSEAKIAHTLGLTPNTVTAIGFVLSFLAALSYALATEKQPLFVLAAVLFMMASGFCDTLDGILARTYQQATPFGGFLDSLLDRYADVLVISGVVIIGASVIISSTFSLIAGLAAIASSFMVSYSRARAEAIGIKMESVGIAERAERILILAASSIIAIFWLPALSIGIVIIAVLATVTVLQRGWHVYRALNKKGNCKEEQAQVRIVVGS
jgi:archaetidylinositol phosphate synthase